MYLNDVLIVWYVTRNVAPIKNILCIVDIAINIVSYFERFESIQLYILFRMCLYLFKQGCVT